ncbi:hypothetical protein CEXT_277531 [Caerostris extrusa]|uniref:Uncharacterized protein n=1 Tax=Caerostris extrusa TaxID=172846 RepID=A0AAV4SJ96_CAEEX|nr:hypothetical protein CEXT_277531 [Caerostris extrusa]
MYLQQRSFYQEQMTESSLRIPPCPELRQFHWPSSAKKMRGQMFMIPSLSSSSSSERGCRDGSLILLWLASKHRIGNGGGSDWKRKEMERRRGI